MLSHDAIWRAIDALAARHGMSPSGLAKRAGLDPTTFNKSKRVSPDGRLRWPSTESVAKVLSATASSIQDFLDAVPELRGTDRGGDRPRRRIPLIGLAQAGGGGYFDDAGFPVGSGWDEVDFPTERDDAVYALEVSGDSMLPLYRSGDIIIVSPGAQVRRGDKVVVKTKAGEVMAKVLSRRTARGIELGSLNPDHPARTFPTEEVDWVARIVWASQ